jgi:multisubunit Na+/H+ antiporter MnhE subunit
MTKLSPAPLVACWFSEWILWLLFAENTGWRELTIGAAAAAIATYFVFEFASRKPITSFRLPHGISVIWLLPWVLAHDTAILLLAVARRLAGGNLRSGVAGIPFGAVANRPASRSKRALATTLMTITPNTLVLGVLREREVLFFHRLVPQPASALARRLTQPTGRPA